MRLTCAWMWILFQVCWTFEGPKTVTGPAGGSVSVQCWYNRGYEESVKYWCKETGERQCDHPIQTTGSEAEVKQNRISIQDNHALRTFKVIMENLTNGDAGTYLCGVEKAQQYDIWHPVEVKVTAEFYTTDFSSPNHFENKEQSTKEKGNAGPTTMAFESTQSSNSLMFLVFIKIPIFLAMIVAVVCVHIWNRRRRVSNAKGPPR